MLSQHDDDKILHSMIFIIKVSISSKLIITFTIRNYWSLFIILNIDVLNSLT